MNPTAAVVDHAVLWNNGDDVRPTTASNLPGWNHNRFEHGGTAALCAGADCLDGSDGFAPDFMSYAPDLPTPLTALPLPRIGGNLWNQDSGGTDRNGTIADLGFSGGPDGWTDRLYLTFDDAIPDIWEETYFRDIPGFTPSLILPDDDQDGDGASNEAEYLAGTHPRIIDTDEDGDSDGLELMLGCDPLDGASSVAAGSCP
jgi:hypothetical protein